MPFVAPFFFCALLHEYVHRTACRSTIANKVCAHLAASLLYAPPRSGSLSAILLFRTQCQRHVLPPIAKSPTQTSGLLFKGPDSQIGTFEMIQPEGANRVENLGYVSAGPGRIGGMLGAVPIRVGDVPASTRFALPCKMAPWLSLTPLWKVIGSGLALVALLAFCRSHCSLIRLAKRRIQTSCSL